jgi:hypothetical protein
MRLYWNELIVQYVVAKSIDIFLYPNFKWHEVKISNISFWLPIIHYGNIYIIFYFISLTFYLNPIILAMVVPESITYWKAKKIECS